MKLKAIFAILLLADSYACPDTVVYTYNGSGACTSRKLSSKTIQKSRQNLDNDNAKVMLDDTEISYTSLPNEDIIIHTSSDNHESRLSYILSDLQGRVFLEGDITDSQTLVPLSVMTAGIYILHVSDRTSSESFKVIKK